MSTLKSKIMTFLTSNPAIAKINFDFNGVKIWPGAYKDVADAMDRGDILLTITRNIEAGASAAYNPETDEFKVSPSFDIRYPGSCAVLIHESTHAYLDRLSMGCLVVKTGEACGYLAQATFLELNGLDPLGNVADILTVAIGIA